MFKITNLQKLKEMNTEELGDFLLKIYNDGYKQGCFDTMWQQSDDDPDYYMWLEKSE